MRFLIAILLFVSANAAAARWLVEAEEGGRVQWLTDSVADIHAAGGLTLWYNEEMRGDVVIEYDARIVGDGRVSDLNCFWMATTQGASPVTAKLLRQRGGRFVDTYTMSLYYVGYGGNHNSTTRFRRYTGDERGVEEVSYRPPVMREYLDSTHLLQPDHWYHIRLEQLAGRIRYIIDGECLVDYADPQPLTHGYFGFRTTLSHAQLRNFRYTCDNSTQSPITVTPIDGQADVKTLRRPMPVTFGLPFAQGELPASATLEVKAGGRTLPSDQWTLATWPDGTVKWQAVATVTDADTLCVSKAVKPRKVSVDKELTLHTSNSGDILDSITGSDSKKLLGRLWMELNGSRQPVTSVVCEQQGQLRDCWRMEGDNFCVRLYTYRGTDEVKMVHTVFIDSLTNADGLQSLVIKAEVPLRSKLHQRRVLFADGQGGVIRHDVKPLVSRRKLTLNDNAEPADSLTATLLPWLAAWDGFRLSQLSPNAYSVRKRATAVSPWIGTQEGTRSPGLVAVGNDGGAVAMQLTDFWQSYPSTLQVDAARSDNAVVSLYLWSKEAEPMLFCHYDTVAHGLEAAYEDVQPGMSTALGTARTSTIYIHPASMPIDSMQQHLAAMQSHPQYLPSPEYLHRKRAFGIWSLDSGTSIDTTLAAIVDYYAREQEKHAWYGFFNYGDVMHTYDPERSEWRYDVGGYAWDNTELGTPAMLWYEFLRTGSPLAWRMAVSMSRHNAEVDSYHRSPHAGLGTRHNVLHWGCGAKEARISQAFFNRFLYYLTADERTGDILREVVEADTLLYHLDPMRLAQPRSAQYPCTAPARLRVGPDWVAYAGNWFTEWERTGNTAYRDKILAGMKSISAMPHGIFSGPKTLGYDPATGIVSWEGDSAVQNTNHLLSIMGGFEMMNEMMMSVSTPEWQQTWLSHAAEYKEKALSISRNHFRIPRLKAYAYWLTGKLAYRQAAWKDLRTPFSQGSIRYTNDAATYALDAIFMQEVLR